MEIDKTIITKVKEFLGIDEEMSTSELLSILESCRNNFHPDKFKEREIKSEAEEKFKTANSLLDDLKKLSESEMLAMGAKEIALHKPFYEKANLQSDLNEALDKIDRNNIEIEQLNSKVKSLEKELSHKKSKEFDNETKRLSRLYKPSKTKLASLGLVVALSLVIPAMNKIESIHSIISKYSPVSKETLSLSVFIALVALVTLVIKQLIENKFVIRKVGDIQSIKYSKDFMEYLKIKYGYEKNNHFKETDVFDFIRGNDSTSKRILSYLGLKSFHIETTDQLKDFFIYYLLNKELISILNASDLDRIFEIKKGGRFSYADYRKIVDDI